MLFILKDKPIVTRKEEVFLERLKFGFDGSFLVLQSCSVLLNFPALIIYFFFRTHKSSLKSL